MGLYKKFIYTMLFIDLFIIILAMVYIRGYQVLMDDITIGYITEIFDLNQYLMNDNGYIEPNGAIKFHPTYFQKRLQVDNETIVDYVKTHGIQYYKYYEIVINDTPQLYISGDRQATQIYKDLIACSYEQDIEIKTKYATEIDYSNEESIKLAHQNIIQKSKEDYVYSFRKPIDKGIITSRYGLRSRGFHYGLDVADKIGTKIYASQTGKVIFAGNSGAYGNLIKIEHKYGYVTYYAHCNKLLCNVGDIVERGQLIAYMGSTGRSTGSHVHFEIRLNGKILNPYEYIY